MVDATEFVTNDRIRARLVRRDLYDVFIPGNDLDVDIDWLHLTSMDYNHGFSLQPVNINIQIVPGYEHVIKITPNQSGTYSIVCNEFCGINHHAMVSRLYVK